MPIGAKTFRVAIACLAAWLPAGAHAEGIDTEHIFAFMIGADVGEVGEHEFQSTTTGRFARSGGTYRTLDQQLELELVPFGISGSKWAAISSRIRSAAFRLWKIGGNWACRVGPSIYATNSSIGTAHLSV